MKHKERLIVIFCLFCFMKLSDIAINHIVSNRHSNESQLTPEVIEGKRIEFNFSVQKDDLLDILGVPVPVLGPIVPHVILHNPLLCSSDSSTLDFVIYAHSFVHNWERRQVLRSTYANPKLFKSIRFQVIFFLGLSKEFGRQQMIKKEFDEYGDIVQGDFIDAYRSTTLKAILAITWISRHCSEADYALKIDDDAFLNLFEMIPIMQQNLNSPLVVICPVWPNGSVPVFRDKRTCMKWCVSFRQFQASSFPRYCAGLSYVLSRELIPRLVEAIFKTPFFWVDDVYITGLLMKNVRTSSLEEVRFVTILNRMEVRKELGVSILANTSVPMTKYLFHTNSTEKFVHMWQLLIDRLTKEQRQMIHLPKNTSLTNLARAMSIHTAL